MMSWKMCSRCNKEALEGYTLCSSCFIEYLRELKGEVEQE